MSRPLPILAHVYVYACVASKDHVMLMLMVASPLANRDLKIQRKNSRENVA